MVHVGALPDEHAVILLEAPSQLPEGVPLALWGVVALAVAALLAGWAWMCHLADTEREGDDRGLFRRQAVMSASLAGSAAVLGVVWLVVGLVEGGYGVAVAVVAPVLAAAAISLLLRRRRRLLAPPADASSRPTSDDAP